MRTTHHHRGLSVLTATAALTVLAGCGGDGGGGTQPATAAGLEAAVADYAAAFVDAPASVYDSFSAACRDAVSRSDWAGEFAAGAAMFEAFFGMPFSDLTVGEVTVRDVTATEGQATVELLTPDGEPVGDDEYSTWVYEDGAWRTTDCDTGESTGDDLRPGGDAAPSVTGELRPADEAVEARERDEAAAGTVGGDPVDVDGLTVTVTAVRFAEDKDGNGTDDDFTIAADVVVENRTGEDRTIPEVEVRCADGTDGGWYADSTYAMFDDLPSGTFADGTVILGVPAGCADPVVRIADFGANAAAVWPVPDTALP